MNQPLLPFPNWDEIEVNPDISTEFVENLISGTPVPTELSRWNEGYSPLKVLTTLTKLLIENPKASLWQNIYTNDTFKNNLGGYLMVFGDQLLLLRDGPAPHFEFIDPMDNSTIGIFPQECIFTHGRYNGIPHPGYLRSIIYAKELYPELPVTLAIETDNYSIREGQKPFLSVLFRASLLYYTGLVDRLVIIQSPYYADDVFGEKYGGSNLYWEYMYGVDTGIINPRVLISYGVEDYERKDLRRQTRLNIQCIDTMEIQDAAEIHMSGIRNNTLHPQTIIEEWVRVAMKVIN